MEPSAKEMSKMADMIMCGDHPSFTKKDLNAKEFKEDKEKVSHPKISPSASRTCGGAGGELKARVSDQLMRSEARRRVRSLEQMPRVELESASGNRALIQAALGSFRWPPYLLAVWVVVLVVTHLLHCIVTMMERALPNIKKFCHYLRLWTESVWASETDSHNVYPLAILTGLVYGVYYSLYVLYAVAVWSIEPLYADEDKKEDDFMETKVTNYVDDLCCKEVVKH